jgi:hypothetical protein
MRDMNLEEALADDDVMYGYLVLLDLEGNEVSDRASVGVHTTFDQPATRREPGKLSIHIDREIRLTPTKFGEVRPVVMVPSLGPVIGMPLVELHTVYDEYVLEP